MVWDGDTYPFPNFSDVVVEVWKWKSNLSHTLLGVSLLIHAGINVNVYKLFPCGSNERNDNDVVKWKHFPSCSPFVRRIHRWPVRGEFPAQRPVTRSCDLFVDLHLKKRLSTKSGGWWFERPSPPLWRHCNDNHDDMTARERFPHCSSFGMGCIAGPLRCFPHKSSEMLRFYIFVDVRLKKLWTNSRVESNFWCKDANVA